jgi:formiminotetrahydrofolate cyclodeaminase
MKKDDSLIPAAILEAVAAPTPTVGGGSVSALAGALGAALAEMVAGLTLKKPAYADVAEEMHQVRERAESLRARLAESIVADSEAYSAVMRAYALPKGTELEKAARRDAIQAALLGACDAPMQVARMSVEVLQLAREVAAKGLATAVCDSGVAAYMAQAALQGALLNVAVNVRGIKDTAVTSALRVEGVSLREQGAVLADEVEHLVAARLSS